MFDVGIGELLALGILALMIFGPDRLPKAASNAARFLRHARSLATTARADLSDAAGIDLSDTVKSLSDLHPRTMVNQFLEDVPNPMEELQGPLSELRTDVARPKAISD